MVDTYNSKVATQSFIPEPTVDKITLERRSLSLFNAFPNPYEFEGTISPSTLDAFCSILQDSVSGFKKRLPDRINFCLGFGELPVVIAERYIKRSINIGIPNKYINSVFYLTPTVNKHSSLNNCRTISLDVIDKDSNESSTVSFEINAEYLRPASSQEIVLKTRNLDFLVQCYQQFLKFKDIMRESDIGVDTFGALTAIPAVSVVSSSPNISMDMRMYYWASLYNLVLGEALVNARNWFDFKANVPMYEYFTSDNTTPSVRVLLEYFVVSCKLNERKLTGRTYDSSDPTNYFSIPFVDVSSYVKLILNKIIDNMSDEDTLRLDMINEIERTLIREDDEVKRHKMTNALTYDPKSYVGAIQNNKPLFTYLYLGLLQTVTLSKKSLILFLSILDDYGSEVLGEITE